MNIRVEDATLPMVDRQLKVSSGEHLEYQSHLERFNHRKREHLICNTIPLFDKFIILALVMINIFLKSKIACSLNMIDLF